MECILSVDPSSSKRQATSVILSKGAPTLRCFAHVLFPRLTTTTPSALLPRTPWSPSSLRSCWRCRLQTTFYSSCFACVPCPTRICRESAQKAALSRPSSVICALSSLSNLTLSLLSPVMRSRDCDETIY